MSFSKIPSVHILSIAFDGSNFACLDSNGVRVFLLDKHFKFLEIINLKYKYSSICYDVTDNCYWAIANNRASTIYQLDNNFKETNKIYLRRPNNANAIATGLSYNKLEDTIWISFSTGIGYAQKVNRKTNYTDNQSKIRFNRAVLSLPNGELISYLEDKDHCDHSKKPCCDPCKKPCHDSCKDHCDHSKKPCCDPCKDHCDPCCPCDKYKCCCDAKSKIMQSIALEEAALAHILNAEGEKIQKAVAEFESTDKLIAVNESVKDTIIHITQLETQLYLKLESVRKDNCKNRYCHID